MIKRKPEVVFNSQFLDFARHYGFSLYACTPGRANEKGRVERVIRDIGGFISGNFFTDMDDCLQSTTYGMICSMSRKGDCWDNAVAESFFHSLKTEWTSGMLYRSRNDARSEAIHYIEMFYNSHRLHSYLEYKNQNEVEKNYTVAKAA